MPSRSSVALASTPNTRDWSLFDFRGGAGVPAGAV